MTIPELDSKKNELLNEVNELIKTKKILYSNMDITSPMSSDEKDLNIQINCLFSQINIIIREKRRIKKAI